jgi:hypothetical protein
MNSSLDHQIIASAIALAKADDFLIPPSGVIALRDGTTFFSQLSPSLKKMSYSEQSTFFSRNNFHLSKPTPYTLPCNWCKYQPDHGRSTIAIEIVDRQALSRFR